MKRFKIAYQIYNHNFPYIPWLVAWREAAFWLSFRKS